MTPKTALPELPAPVCQGLHPETGELIYSHTDEAMRAYARAAVEQASEDSARLDWLERTYSGVTNRERYLPVQMIWGKGCNGRSLREAIDKYRARAAAPAGEVAGEG
ncbi:hypothetical protein [Pseudoxanthomonas sp.]|uniref:hypothetical protein n=1 Tax=Pseudoxanthomonas sp. TaxID=1871049 RepID=UPI0026077745|nr:hypothetical protein [Pseudoxanthomonas sp.]WDS36193.1 MAG: hypothetical protein O8I58_18310 [Pseudoxanthomonas sp.]